jgi:hypothetical protein
MFTPIFDTFPHAVTNLHVDPHGFRIEWGANTADISLDRIVRIEAWKRDELTDDLTANVICLDIMLRDRGLGSTHLIHQKMHGWDEAVAKLEELEGFDKLWFDKVSNLRFTGDRILVYERS